MSERKVLTLKDASVSDSGEFVGLGAAFGNLDDGGDIIEPGFFEPVIDDFMKEGFISWMHDWGNPVAIPTAAKEIDPGLQIAAQFHSTPQAQEKRTITQERLAAGKTMGLSIGYDVAEDGFTIDKDTGIRHLTKASRLFETGLVLVPMNRLAGVTDVKGGLTYAEENADIISRLRGYMARSREMVRPRKEGRVLSAANRDRLEALHGALADTIAEIEDLLASTDPTDEGKAAIAQQLEIEYLEQLARWDGNLTN